MKLIRGTQGQCLLCSMAMLLDTTLEELEPEVRWEDWDQYGYHVGQFAESALKRGQAYMFIEREFKILWNGNVISLENPNFKIEGRGIIIGEVEGKNYAHAVAFDGNGLIYDPRGYIFHSKGEVPKLKITHFLKFFSLRA